MVIPDSSCFQHSTRVTAQEVTLQTRCPRLSATCCSIVKKNWIQIYVTVIKRQNATAENYTKRVRCKVKPYAAVVKWIKCRCRKVYRYIFDCHKM